MSDQAKPLKPYDDRDGDASRDEAKGGYSLYSLERMLASCDSQPDWRSRADLCCAYYDGKQFSQAQLQMIERERLDQRVTNLVKPVVNSVLGQEAKSRTDVKLEADDDGFQDVVDALSPKLKEAERETLAHMAVSNAYGSMVKAGVGWVEVARNADPLAYPYRVTDVHRNEVWWDWEGAMRSVTMDGARWLVRKRFVDLDELQAAMPKFKDVLAAAVNGWDSLTVGTHFLGEPDDRIRFFSESMAAQRRFNSSRGDWVDSARKRVKLYEVWYRVPATVVILHLRNGKRIAYDERDPRHVEAVSRGMVRVTKGVTSQVRTALFAGPHRLTDMGTKLKRFPYIPFFAFRDDDDMSPYGLIDPMIAPQDEYNERRLRLQWMLKAKQVDIDNDALDLKYNTIADVEANAMRPDMVTVLNANRKFAEGVRRRNDLLLPAEQMAVMSDAKQLIQDVSGRYTSQLGSAPGQVTSGIANSLLIDQGEQSMGEMNDNYTFARRAVFEVLTGYMAEDHAQAEMQMLVGSGSNKRVVVLNTWDQQGMPVNHVKDVEMRVGLGEVPASPAFRMQQQQQVSQIIQALGSIPQAVAVLAPVYVEGSSLPDRKMVADDLRRATGQPTAEDRAGREQAQKAVAAQQQKAQQQADAVFQAELQAKTSKSALETANARKVNAEAMELERRLASGADMAEDRAGVAKTGSEVALNQARIGQMAEQADLQRREAGAANEDEMVNDALREALA